jgi:tetratricopeptide (TPR) repeat protein
MVRSLALVLALSAAVAAVPPPPAGTPLAARGYWLQPAPADDMETAVHTAVTDPATAGTAQAAQTLRDLATQHPGGGGAGLARLGAGLLYLDHQQYADAEPLLLDGEIAKTHLEDHAWKALAELYEKTGDFAKAADEYDKLVARADPDPFRCTALLRGAAVHVVIGKRDEALEMVQRALASCPAREAQALLKIASYEDQRGHRRAAA